MAKKSKRVKYAKQLQAIENYAEVRRSLKEARDFAALAKLPLDSNPVRLKRRDLLDGRPRGYMRKFGMSRIHFRKYASLGQIPGVKKSSW